MKRSLLMAICIVLSLSIGDVRAAIVWQDDPATPYQQFRFDVAKNQGTFGSSELSYYPFLRDEEFFAYDPANSYFDSYDSVATGNIVVFDSDPEEVRLNAMAKGPDGGVAPPYGLVVQGYLETIATGLTMDNRMDSQQQVASFIGRRFKVDEDGDYTITADLNGLVNFAAFDQGSSNQATYNVSGSVTLTQIIGNSFTTVPGFPLSLSDTEPSKNITVPLVIMNQSLQNITYQLTISLQLNNHIVNFDQGSFQVLRVIDGSYQLGSADSPFKLNARITGPGMDNDSDGDGVLDSVDNCPDVANGDQADSDNDTVGDVCDGCPDDANKNDPGTCGCGIADTDTDSDGTPDCVDSCPGDGTKTEPGVCGCGNPETDTDSDGTPDCVDNCPDDNAKTEPGVCGCGTPETVTDSDGDGFVDCLDAFPDDGSEWLDTDNDKTGNNADLDDDNDGMPDAYEEANGHDPLVDDSQADADGDGRNNLLEFKRGTDPNDPTSFPAVNLVGQMILLGLLTDDDGNGIADKDGDGVADINDNCPDVANAMQTDSDGDDVGDDCDGCADDPGKIDAGVCGCGTVDSDIDSDGDTIIDCLDPFPNGVDCEALTSDGCQLPAPENVSNVFVTDSGNTYAQMSWAAVECAGSYWLRIGTPSNLTELDYNNLNFVEVDVYSTSYRYNVTSLSAGTYYFAVLPSCGLGANAEMGTEWSIVESFDWPQP